MKKIIVLLLIVVLLFTFVGCKNDDDKNDGDVEIQTGEVVENMEKTQTYLVKNKVSPYIIVVPHGDGNIINVARDLQTLFKEITGADIVIKEDLEIVDALGGKYLSIGNNTVSQANNVVLPDGLGYSGTYVKTVGNSVFMLGNTPTASCFAVYKFLKYQFGFECYTYDAYDYTYSETAKLINVDKYEIPDIEYPYCAIGRVVDWVDETSPILRYRLGGVYGDIDYFSNGLSTHTFFQLIPVATYFSQHPEWFNKTVDLQGNVVYATNPTQLCLSNDEMIDQLVENLKGYIADSNDLATTFMIGQEDNNGFCECPECQKMMQEECGGYRSGQMVLFANKVIAKIKPWIQENYPQKNIRFAVFAYVRTVAPPVKYENGVYKPINDKMICDDMLEVYYAPIEMRYRSIYAQCNEGVKANLEGWLALTNRISFWGYSLNEVDAIGYISNFSYYGDTYKYLAELNKQGKLGLVQEEGFYNAIYPAQLDGLRTYLVLKLMWNTNLNVDALINKYFNGVYREGGKYIKEYVDLMNMHFQYLEEEYNFIMYCHVDTITTMYYPKYVVDKSLELFEKALNAIEKYKDTDPKFYEQAKKSLEGESLSPRYLQLKLYMNYLSREEALKKIDEFERIGSQWNFGSGYVDELKSMIG